MARSAWLLTVLLGCAAFGQQTPAPQPPAPPAARDWGAYLQQKPAGPWIPHSSAQHAPPPSTALSMTGKCSVPLLELRVEHPERYTMKTFKGSETVDKIATAVVPAPPCPPAK